LANQNKHSSYFYRVALLATCLAFVVVVLGAFARLNDAGLGCPDWPGCYGQLTVPKTSAEIELAKQLYPAQPVEAGKAWSEMVHRYFAGSLGLLIVVLAGWSLLRRRKHATQIIGVPLFLVGFTIFQAALGMWTVTWKLLPQVVMGHLLGGMTILSLLWWLSLSAKPQPLTLQPKNKRLFTYAVIGLIIVAAQIFLGGWTSSNYAAIVCPNFPFCVGELFPSMDLAQGFNLFSPIGANYQGGVLHTAARIAIQMMHRYGAFITFIYVAGLAFLLMLKQPLAKLKGIGAVMLGVLIIQIILGVLNIETQLQPMFIPVAHNAVAAILLLVMVTLVFNVKRKK
jgi:cytochrome c oxidase assembly protein subunit 15